MTERQILLVKHSWSFVIIRSEEAGDVFYTHLFELAPDLEAMFRNDRAVQSRKLINMITAIIIRIQKLEDFMPELHALAQRHVTYGTKAEHYPLVGKALLSMLEYGLGTRWTEETHVAWQMIYDTISQAMIQASAQKLHVKSE